MDNMVYSLSINPFRLAELVVGNDSTPNIHYDNQFQINGIFAIELDTFYEYFIETSYVTDDLFKSEQI